MTKKERRENKKYLLISVVSFIVFILIWELVTDVLGLVSEKKLPSPQTIVEVFVYKLSNTNPDGNGCSLEKRGRITIYKNIIIQ